MDKRKFFILGFLLIAVSVMIFYSSALKLNFLYEDDYAIIKAALQSPKIYFLGTFTGQTFIAPFYRPLVPVLTKIDYILWGINPFGYHLTNILLHTLNSCLVLSLAYYLFGDYLFALFAGMLFALLPMNAEAVNWICCRGDLMATTFYLLAFYSFLIYSNNNKKLAFASSIVFFILSLGSKESALSLPILLLAYNYFSGDLKKRGWEISAYFGVLILYVMLRVALFTAPFSSYPFGVKRFIANAIFGNIKTFQLLFMPFQQENLFLYFILLPLITIACAIFVSIYIKKVKPPYLFYFFLSWVIITLMPTWHILPIGFNLKASRLWYLPSAGISWIISYIIFAQGSGADKRARIISRAFLALFIIYSCYYLFLANRNFTVASDMTRELRAKAIQTAQRHPKGSTIIFANLPDNYKGCYVGFPYFFEPFYKGDYTIDSCQGIIRNIPNRSYAAPNIEGAYYYVFNYKTRRFDRVSKKFFFDHEIPNLNVDNSSENQFRRFKEKYFK